MSSREKSTLGTLVMLSVLVLGMTVVTSTVAFIAVVAAFGVLLYGIVEAPAPARGPASRPKRADTSPHETAA